MNWREKVTGGYPLYPLLVLFGLNAVDEFDRSAFDVLIPEIRADFGMSLVAITALAAVVAPVAVLLELPMAWLADRRRRVGFAATGALLWATFSVGTGIAGGVAFLIAARAGSGAAKVVNTTHPSLIADYYPPDVRGTAYYVHWLGNSAGLIVAPFVAGQLAERFSWRVPFIVLAVPSVVLFLLALRLREPVRGGHERRLAGGDDEIAEVEEPPAALGEAFRALYRFPTTRRIYLALAFAAAGSFGLATLRSVLYADEFGVGPGDRGIIASAIEPVAIIGLVVGAVVLRRRAGDRPEAILRLVSFAALAASLTPLVLAGAPALGVAIAGDVVAAFSAAIVFPGLVTAASLVLPPRIRTVGFAVAALHQLAALVALPMVGLVADRWGIRAGIVLFTPLLLIATALLFTASRTIAGDAAAMQAAALARAEARRRRQAGDPQLLLVRGLRAGYGGGADLVLDGVDLDVADGELVALLGTNGAGKSTLLRAVSGGVGERSGVVVIDGIDVTDADSAQIAALGVRHVPGGRGVFPHLTVRENLRVAGWGRRRSTEGMTIAIEVALDLFPKLRDRLDVDAGLLSGGEQQMLALAQAMVVTPRLLLIDELTLGLAPKVVTELIELVKEVNRRGVTVVVVEQSVEVALRLADRAVFLEKGEIRYDGPTTELVERPDLLRSVFLGRAAAAVPRAGARRARVRRDETAVLAGHRLEKWFGGVRAVAGVDVTVRQGEIVALIGPNGAGKTSLLDLLSGLVRPEGGSVLLHGANVTGLPPRARAALGMGRTFQGGRLWPALTVEESMLVARDRQARRAGFASEALMVGRAQTAEREARAAAEAAIDRFGLSDFRESSCRELSTGTRRLVELAALVAGGATVLLLDEPASGIAQRETEALAPMLRSLRDDDGCSILLVEHDLALAAAVADRIVVLDAGSVIADGHPRSVLRDPAVVTAYVGS